MQKCKEKLKYILSIERKQRQKMDQDMEYQLACRFIQVLEKIARNQESYVDFTYLSGNPLITMTYVNKHPEKAWHWPALTCNPSVPLTYIEAHPEKPWCPHEYHFRKYAGDWPDVTHKYAVIADTEEPPCGFWDAANVLPVDIERHMPWIDATVAIGYDDIEEYDHGMLTWNQISDNPNLTLDFIDKYHQKHWNIDILSTNPLTIAKAQFSKEYKAAYTIQQAYARAKYIPLYAYCRKLHMQFYDSICAM
jgi:hypothetical protein